MTDHGTAADSRSKPATSGTEGEDSAEKKLGEVEAGAATVKSFPETDAMEIDIQLNQLWPVAVSSLLRRRRVGSEYFHWMGLALAE